MHAQPAAGPAPLSPPVARIAAELRGRYGFLRDVVAEMERSVPYAAALVRFGSGSTLVLRDGEQQAHRRDPQSGIVLTASTGHALEETATDDLEPASAPTRGFPSASLPTSSTTTASRRRTCS